MSRVVLASLASLLTITLASCGQPIPTAEGPHLLAAAGGTDRPFTGACTVTITARIHDEDEGGGCGGGHEEDTGGGPPIGRHYELAGICQLAHLGRATVSGRLNLTGPFGTGHGGEATGGHGGVLGVRGRLLFGAADGDQLVGRYVPVSAGFVPAPGGDGGTLVFTSTQQIGESCSGHTKEAGPGAVTVLAEEGHEEPVSTGRFAEAGGWATMVGTLAVLKSAKGGTGRIRVTDGRLSY